jgi:hypothetical protein
MISINCLFRIRCFSKTRVRKDNTVTFKSAKRIDISAFEQVPKADFLVFGFIARLGLAGRAVTF